ncbi:methionyl-tRNA formyltransferase [Litorivicinus lipolyticus]|uniref:Methionyl-tRNA formyltransferase n=1 Tax=Litorivicinus lipolyticus TaxID=418701 RepID=A0A5Q2Q629_9GAMM|nr:methionyl-tRNA formyltransferase [Litorivicinus lipolyticus]QGG79158.1 methionyl-tRNA formyltransferase [Litorivicinus lipolyticus]
MRVAYAGTPAFAVPALRGLLDHGIDVVGVWTQPDRPAGRGRKLTPSPVKQVALERGVAVHQPHNFKAQADRDDLLNCGADLFIVAAYGLLLPQPIIDGFAHGCVNLHGSLLPRWRGAAPIQRAIQAGDRETGVGLMRMEIGLDTGPVIGEMRTPISADDTTANVHDRLAAMGWPLLQRHWDDLAGDAPGIAQSDQHVAYATKISKAEARLDFALPAEQLIRNIHAFNPWPGAWVEGPLGRIKLLSAQPATDTGLAPGQLGTDGVIGCADGSIRVTTWQFAGAKAQPVADLINANRLTPGLNVQPL